MSAFSKADVQNIRIGTELNVCFWLRKRTFRNVSGSSEWENSNGSSPHTPRPRTYDSSVRKGANRGEFLPQISQELILTS